MANTMNDQNEKPVAQQAYNALAEAYAALVDTKPHTAYYERPATLSFVKYDHHRETSNYFENENYKENTS